MPKTVALPLPLPLPWDALLRAPWQRDAWMIRPSPPGGEVPSGIVTFGAHTRCCRNAVRGRSRRHGTTLRRWVIRWVHQCEVMAGRGAKHADSQP